MGRAIVRDPQAFLFDEPLSNLDAKLRVQMRTEIKELHQRLEATIVYVTHDQIEAMTMADKIVVLHDGAVEQIGAPLDLYDRPRNVFVAGFIGSPAMNFMNGRMARDNGVAVFVGEGGARLAIGGNVADGDGRPVTVGVRPEHFVIDSERGAPAEVIVVEPTGSETQVFARYMGREIVALFRDRIDARPGSVIKLSAPPERVHVFDAESGQALGYHSEMAGPSVGRTFGATATNVR